MNDQLKELAYQSGLLSKRVFDDSWVSNPKLEAKLKKFAELVMQDMHKKVIASILITDVVMEEKGQVPTSEDHIQAINNDFGVK